MYVATAITHSEQSPS